MGGKAGNSFSVATFAAREELPAGTEDPAYWESLLPEAVQVRSLPDVRQCKGGEMFLVLADCVLILFWL